jgi:hypothetical protein
LSSLILAVNGNGNAYLNDNINTVLVEESLESNTRSNINGTITI